MATKSSKKTKSKPKKSTGKKGKKPAKTSTKKAVKRSAPKKTKKGKKKNGRRKSIIITLVAVVIILALGIGYVLTNLGFLVKMAIEKAGSQATQTAVRVSGVQISLKEGSCNIEGLNVGNPDGFEVPYAFSLKEIGVDIDPKSITSDEITIDDIVVRAPETFVEVNADNKNNLNEIKNNLPEGSSSPSKDKASPKEKKETRLFIRRLLFEKGRIFAKVVPMNKEYDLSMGAIEMRNLRGTPAQIAQQVISRLTSQALAQVKRKGIGQAEQKIKEQVKSRLNIKKMIK